MKLTLWCVFEMRLRLVEEKGWAVDRACGARVVSFPGHAKVLVRLGVKTSILTQNACKKRGSNQNGSLDVLFQQM